MIVQPVAGHVIEEIFQALETIRQLIQARDPAGQRWELRVICAYRIFRAFDEPRFRLEPADPRKVLADLEELITYLEESSGPDGQASTTRGPEGRSRVFEDGSRRMQYLYGLAWAQLSADQYRDAAGLLALRLRNSNTDLSFLQDAECLDLGTGIARFALAMVQLGARRVVGVDFSVECLEEARRRLAGLEEADRIALQHGDLYRLAGGMTEAFDFVCANGVIHHLPDPQRALEIVHQCTKPGGRAFVFVFAKNEAPWWPAVELMREVAAQVPIDFAYRLLKFWEIPGTKMFNTLDYSYTPIQHKFDREWLEGVLRRIGFREWQFLDGGAIHDSVFRSRQFDTDRQLYGASEIRYLLHK